MNIIKNLVSSSKYNIKCPYPMDAQFIVVHNTANDLNQILDNYIIFQENTQIQIWKEKYASFQESLAAIDSMAVDQKETITKIINNATLLNATFTSLIEFVQTTPRNQSIHVLPEFQVLWIQLSNTNHDIILNSEELSEDIISQANDLHFSFNILVIILLALFGVYFSINFFIVYHRTLNSIAKLQSGIAIIGSGDLDYRVNIKKGDEIATLSDSFNRMTANLKEITASKAELEKEVIRRKHAEQELAEYSKNLERLVEERSKQLKDSERLAAIGQVAGMVEHDIRNPLQAIVSELYLAKQSVAESPESDIKKSALESIYTIQQQIDYINRIVANLQDYTKPLKPQLVEVDLCQLVPESLKTIAIPENIQINMACEGIPKLMLDPTFMRRILTNLFTNAIQAMPNGGSLSIRAFRQIDKVILTVEDTGEGIPEEAKPKLFTPLFTTKAKGQGFGLVVVKRMAEAQNGTITFESQEGKGTKFMIELPTID